jgi:5-methylcytosine-specific restriction protein A
MPTLLHPCPVPGCPALVSSGRCATHRRAENVRRGSSTAQGYDSRWRRYARMFRLYYPLCGDRPLGTPSPDSECARLGKLTPAYVVDHIVPTVGRHDPQFYDSRNHQSLCESCHQAKRWRESRGLVHA